MMPTTAVGKKLDLSTLTEEEAQHVFQVVQRDFDLRKKEEDRLGELKTQLEKEDTKRELLGTGTSLTESHCIRCLQPFKFLVNSKRQCLDCQLYACKACSRYNKKERGWVCDPCHMSRVLKIGTLEWYHENVRSRFKRFGSAKVMRSLYKRLSGDLSASQSDLREPREDDTHSMPESHNLYDENNMDTVADGRHYRMSPQSSLEGGTRESLTAEADMACMFQQILEEQGERHSEFNTEVLHSRRMSLLDKPARFDEVPYPENWMMRARSLSRMSQSSCGSANNGHLRSSGQLYGLEDSEEEEEYQRQYQLLASRRRSHGHFSSQESLNHGAPPQITELNRRMSVIEKLLNRLEQKVTSPYDQGQSCTSPLPQWEEVDLEELQLRQKLDQLTGNISDKGLSSEEDEPKRPPSPKESPGWGRRLRGDVSPSGSLSRPSSRPGIMISPPIDELQEPSEVQAYFSTGHSRSLREGSSLPRYRPTTTTTELFELEGKVAMAAATVQSTVSEVTDIENKIAALSAAGMSVDMTRRKSTVPPQRRRSAYDLPTKTSNGTGSLRRKLSIL
uniref:Melanophilin n=1 Tax=Oncorhynchus kisutch TaxID=8019 RepID=A0A8C7DIQ6_ONCKI